MGVESKSSLDDSAAGNLHNQPMGVEMLGALVVPALKPGDLVLVEPSGPSAEESSTEWWIGWIMQPEGSDRSSFDSYFFPVHDPLVHVEHRRMTVFVHLL